MPEEKPRALIVEDEEMVAKAVKRALEPELACEIIGTAGEALLALRRPDDIDVALVDINLPDLSGIELLKEIRQVRPDTEVIMMTAYGTFEKVVEAMRAGAYDFLPKPFEDMAIVLLRCKGALERRRLARKARLHDARVTEERSFSEIVGQSRPLRELFSLIESVAPSPSTVLIEGESGTGKELVARALHARSPRRDRPFVAVNCAALQESLLESELFGHVKGAFTGAIKDKRGLFEVASGGTLFLDEIGDVSNAIQAKLLRAIQEGEIRRVGGTESLRVDVRIVSATNKNLKKAMEAGRFREDLYYRLAVITMALPPLRDRREDIPLLVFYFLRKYAKKLGRAVTQLEPAALELLTGHNWPGNVRELENVIERAVLLSHGPSVTASALPDPIARRAAPNPLPAAQVPSAVTIPFKEAKTRAVEDFERRYLGTLLAQFGGNISQAARHAGLDRSNFKKILRRYDLRAADA